MTGSIASSASVPCRVLQPRLTRVQTRLHSVAGWILFASIALGGRVGLAHAQTTEWPVELPALQQATSSSSERAPDLPDASPSDSFAGWSALAYAVALPLGVGSFAAGLAFAREENGTNDNIWALASTGIVVAVLLPASVQAAHGQWWGALRTFVGTVLSVAIGFVAYAAISLSTLCIDLSDDSDDRCRPPDPRVPVIATAAGVLPYVGWAITDVLLWSHE